MSWAIDRTIHAGPARTRRIGRLWFGCYLPRCGTPDFRADDRYHAVDVADIRDVIRSEEFADRPRDREALPRLREIAERLRTVEPDVVAGRATVSGVVM